MNYSETIDYLYSRLPMFTRIGAVAIKKDLTNTLELCKQLGNPHTRFRTIHVGGTNGKGSTSHMLAAILQQAGYKTGLYTSPHLKDFRERIRINGKMIPEAEVIDFVAQQRENIEKIAPSFFELTVAMAFDHFARNEVDIAIIEVGLGGRLDSTNVITPLLSLITNISYDHTNLLGNTLPEIAYEKAGIIKPGVPVIIGQRQPEVEQVFIAKAAETRSPLIFASDKWLVEENETEGEGKKMSGLMPVSAYRLSGTTSERANSLTVHLDLTASYQLKNLPAVLCAVDELRKQQFRIVDEDVREALSRVKTLTGLMGRWQVLAENPLIICDTGHNEDGIREVVKNIQKTPHRNLHIVIGMVKDKDIATVLRLLPRHAVYYFCSPDVERGKPADELAAEAHALQLIGKSYSSVKAALEAAKTHAEKDDLIFVGGSTFVVAEII